jgi:hypothetical protein
MSMFRRALLLAALTAALGGPAYGLAPTGIQLLSDAWPAGTATRIDDIGRGIGVVFSPDLSVRNNCRFYEALGFACFEDASWQRVLDDIHRRNVLYPEGRIQTLVLETHGTNGNGAKLQATHAPTADRSYVSIGALQERLERDGIRYVIISACNSGRLLRPDIYTRLDPYNGDKLFLPATCGIVDASSYFKQESSPVTIITPRASHIETTLVGRIAELAPATRRALAASAKAKGIRLPKEFAISDMMMQMLLRDSRLQLAANTSVDALSKEILAQDNSERNFRRFVGYLNGVAGPPAVKKKPALVAKKKGVGGKKLAAK